MATMGLLSSSLIGSLFILLGKIFKITNQTEFIENKDNKDFKFNFNIYADLRILLVNVGFVGLAIFIGVLLLKTIRMSSTIFGDFSKEVINSLPVFPLILIGSLLIRYVLEKTEQTAFISKILQREIGILSTDLLIFSAMSSLNLSTVMNNLSTILLLTIFGLLWNVLCIAFFSYFVFDDFWFEKGLVEFGNSTGVVASGLLLLRLADPNNLSKTLPIFTSKQLFAQLLLSGGFFTVLSPFLLSRIGLTYWTELCGALSLLVVIIAFFLNNKLTVLFK